MRHFAVVVLVLGLAGCSSSPTMSSSTTTAVTSTASSATQASTPQPDPTPQGTPVAATSCAAPITPTSHTFDTGVFFWFTVTAPADCTWTYKADVSWLQMFDAQSKTSSSAGRSGTATGSAFVEVFFDSDTMYACNCGQTATVTIAGQKIAINNRAGTAR